MGVVFDARAKPKPLGYSTRMPSIVIFCRAESKWEEVFSFSVNVKFSPSWHWICNSGVEIDFGNSLNDESTDNCLLKYSKRRAPA